MDQIIIMKKNIKKVKEVLKLMNQMKMNIRLILLRIYYFLIIFQLKKIIKIIKKSITEKIKKAIKKTITLII